ncbi:MAG: AfsR/SARP family transcriptional regulator [Acidimicrobiales bacterium]
MAILALAGLGLLANRLRRLRPPVRTGLVVDATSGPSLRRPGQAALPLRRALELAAADAGLPEPGSPPSASPTPPPEVAEGPVESAAVPGVKVLILGPVEVEFHNGARLSGAPLEVLIYLTLHRERRLSPSRLASNLRPGARRPPSARTLSSYVSAVRRVLPAGAIPDSTGWQGYQLMSESVTSDWGELVALAKAATHLDGESAVKPLSRAMDLIRGKAFADHEPRLLPWVDAERWEDKISLVVEAVAHQLAQAREALGEDLEALLGTRLATLTGSATTPVDRELRGPRK